MVGFSQWTRCATACAVCSCRTHGLHRRPPSLSLLQELAHLYHYYLHGEQGNRTAGGSKAVREGRLPNGEPFPDIVLQYQVGGCLGAFPIQMLSEPCWQLAEAGRALLPPSQPDVLLLPPLPPPSPALSRWTRAPCGASACRRWMMTWRPSC